MELIHPVREYPGYKTGLRVASLNLWGGFGDWAARRKIIREEWSYINADILLLQEACADDEDQASQLSYDLQLPFMCRETHMQHSNGMREGLAILSSLELGNTQILLLPSSQPARRMIETEVTVHDHLIRLRNFHATYAPSAARQAQIEAALTPSEGSLIVGGDFNIRPHQLELLLAGRLCDPQAGSQACTWPLDWEQLSIAWERKLGVPPHFSFDPSRIDYLLVKEVAVQESGVLALGSPGHWASDHALIWLDLEPDLKTLQNVCSDRLVYTRASRDSPLTCLAQP